MTDTIEMGDISEAASRIQGAIVPTPLLESTELNGLIEGRVFIKAESLQRTGSFKFRGAINRLSRLSPSERPAGVVAWSSGNHAQGIAAAAQLLGIPAAIVMPKDAPAVKVEKTLAYGAEIITYDRQLEDREKIGRELAHRRGAVLVPSYDDPHIIAGQGTVGLELADQLCVRGQSLDALLVGCGGGGLIAGIATALAESSPSTAVYCVEPAGFDDYGRSLRSGRREINARCTGSICDALLADSPGKLTFDINRKLLKAGLVVKDSEVRNAMRFAYTALKLVVEPSGAVALAAVLSGKISTKDQCIGLVISGGNVDPSLYGQIINGS